jgi:hypothetical protein
VVVIAYLANCVSASTCCNCSYNFIATTSVWSTKWAYSCSTRISLMGQNMLKGANNITLDKETSWFTIFFFFFMLTHGKQWLGFSKGWDEMWNPSSSSSHEHVIHKKPIFFACRLRCSFVFKLPLFKFSHHL